MRKRVSGRRERERVAKGEPERVDRSANKELHCTSHIAYKTQSTGTQLREGSEYLKPDENH